MSFRQHGVTSIAIFEPALAHSPAAAWFVPRGGRGRCTTAGRPGSVSKLRALHETWARALRASNSRCGLPFSGEGSQPPPVSARERACCLAEAFCGW